VQGYDSVAGGEAAGGRTEKNSSPTIESMSSLIETMGEMKKAVETGDNRRPSDFTSPSRTREEDAHDKVNGKRRKGSGERISG